MKFALSSFAMVGGLMLLALSSPKDTFDKQAATLKAAGSLQVTFKSQKLPGEAVEYKLVYSKPNLLTIDGPGRLLASDGKTLWEYDKKANTYSEQAMTPQLLSQKSQGEEVLAWAYFFGEDLTKSMGAVTGGTSRNLRGNAVTEVSYEIGGAHPKKVTLYVDDKLGVPRGISLKTDVGDWLVMASDITVGKEPLPVDKFVFTAPQGAQKAQTATSAAEGGISYAATIEPILKENCGGCHGGRGRAGFSINSYQTVMAGSRSGAVITPGDPDNSKLVKLLTGEMQPKMPQGGQLSDADIQKIKDWIKAGAKP